MIISRSFLLRMRNVSDKSYRENQNTHFGVQYFFFFKILGIYEMMWKNIVELVRSQITIWRMRIAWVLVRKPERKRTLGKPRRKWEDNIKMNPQEVGREGLDWLDVVQDRDRWRALVNVVMNLRVR